MSVFINNWGYLVFIAFFMGIGFVYANTTPTASSTVLFQEQATLRQDLEKILARHLQDIKTEQSALQDEGQRLQDRQTQLDAARALLDATFATLPTENDLIPSSSTLSATLTTDQQGLTAQKNSLETERQRLAEEEIKIIQLYQNFQTKQDLFFEKSTLLRERLDTLAQSKSRETQYNEANSLRMSQLTQLESLLTVEKIPTESQVDKKKTIS